MRGFLLAEGLLGRAAIGQQAWKGTVQMPPNRLMESGSKLDERDEQSLTVAF